MNWILLTIGAGQDLFSDTWTTGNLYSINGIVEKLGNFACWVISVVGFGIVIFSILKNALSGLYVVNPNLWDKVDEAKTNISKAAGSVGNILPGDNNIAKNGNVAIQKVGGVLSGILTLLPNVKALTDFDDNDKDINKKQYFMKSIPLLVAQIFIGMLIFFGYPAKLANWIGSGATYMVNAIIKNVDPIQVVAKISDSFTVYTLSTDGSQDPWEQNINKMASDMVSIMGTKYDDMDKSNVQNLAYVIESQLLDAFNIDSIRTILGANEGYVYAVSATIQASEPQYSSSFANVGNEVYSAQATNGTISYRYKIQASSIINDAKYTTKLNSNDYMVWQITATPVAVANISTANLIVCGGISNVPTVANGSFSLNIAGITVGDGTSDVKGVLGRVVTVTAINSDGTAMATFNATLQSASVNQKTNANAVLSFSAGDRQRLSDAMNDGTFNYLKVSLVGDWTKTVASADGKTSTTLRVTEFRLAKNESAVSYLLSTWTNVNGKTNKGETTLTSETLKKSEYETKASEKQPETEKQSETTTAEKK